MKKVLWAEVWSLSDSEEQVRAKNPNAELLFQDIPYSKQFLYKKGVYFHDCAFALNDGTRVHQLYWDEGLNFIKSRSYLLTDWPGRADVIWHQYEPVWRKGAWNLSSVHGVVSNRHSHEKEIVVQKLPGSQQVAYRVDTMQWYEFSIKGKSVYSDYYRTSPTHQIEGEIRGNSVRKVTIQRL